MRNKGKQLKENGENCEKGGGNDRKYRKKAQKKDQRLEFLKVSSTLVEVSMRRKRLLFQ